LGTRILEAFSSQLGATVKRTQDATGFRIVLTVPRHTSG
jgi:hypothetical protein